MKENDGFFVNLVKEGILQVSNSGVVFNNKTNRKIGAVGSGGYYKISIKDHNKGIIRHMQVHRLVFLVHVSDIPENLVINHIDGNKLNNDFGNLELVTNTGNASHAKELGLVRYCNAEENGQAKFNNEEVIYLRTRYAKRQLNIKEAAELYSVSEATIINVLSGKTYNKVKSESDDICKKLLTDRRNSCKIEDCVVQNIKHLHRIERKSSYEISRLLKVNRNTVMKYW